MLYPASKRLIAANTILGSLATIAVALRLIARKKKKLPLAGDDYTIIVAWMIALGLSIEGIYAGANNVFILNSPSASSKERRNKILWIDVFLCHFVYGLIKISVLLFYKRLFTTKRFRLVANIFMGMVIAWMAAAVFAQIFSVLPVHTWWTDPGIAKTTFDYQLWLLVMAGLDIALDVITLALAFPVIANLQMSVKRKISLGSVFALGLFCVVASGVRTYYVWKNEQVLHGKLPFSVLEATLVWIDIWGHIEASASIVTACLPSIAPLFSGIKTPESILNGFRSLSSLTISSPFFSSKSSRLSRDSHPSVCEKSWHPDPRPHYISGGSLHRDTDHEMVSDVESQGLQNDSIVVKKTFGVHTETSSYH